jgi:hypothetical protein
MGMEAPAGGRRPQSRAGGRICVVKKGWFPDRWTFRVDEISRASTRLLLTSSKEAKSDTSALTPTTFSRAANAKQLS